MFYEKYHTPGQIGFSDFGDTDISYVHNLEQHQVFTELSLAKLINYHLRGYHIDVFHSFSPFNISRLCIKSRKY